MRDRSGSPKGMQFGSRVGVRSGEERRGFEPCYASAITVPVADCERVCAAARLDATVPVGVQVAGSLTRVHRVRIYVRGACEWVGTGSFGSVGASGSLLVCTGYVFPYAVHVSGSEPAHSEARRSRSQPTAPVQGLGPSNRGRLSYPAGSLEGLCRRTG